MNNDYCILCGGPCLFPPLEIKIIEGLNRLSKAWQKEWAKEAEEKIFQDVPKTP